MAKFYNPVNVLSKFEPFNFIMTNRGPGKTFGWSYYALKTFMETGRRFVWCRRTKANLQLIAPTWAANISQKPIFKGHEIKTDNEHIYLDGKVAGYFKAISDAANNKSIALPDVDLIVYDEFIPEDERYLGGKNRPDLEPELCLNLYQSIARGYNQPVRDVRMVFLANHVSRQNPYFAYFGLDKFITPETEKLRINGCYVEIGVYEDIAKEIKESKFGKAIEHTRYGMYANDGKYYLDNDVFLEKKPSKGGIYYFNLAYLGTIYAVWGFDEKGFWYISDKDVDVSRETYALSTEDSRPNYINLQNMKPKFKYLSRLYGYGALRFSSLKAKKFFESVVLTK